MKMDHWRRTCSNKIDHKDFITKDVEEVLDWTANGEEDEENFRQQNLQRQAISVDANQVKPT